MDKLIFFLFIASMTGVIACNKGYPGGYGWGWDGPAYIYLPKPTLLPRLKKAFIDGKLSVNVHKIIAPSLKPLPYKKGVGWLHKIYGWPYHSHGIGHFNAHGYFPIHIGKSGYVRLNGGVEYGEGYGRDPIGSVGSNVGLGHIPVTSIPPVHAKLPVPDHADVHEHHHHHGVFIVDKGHGGPHHPVPHNHPDPGPLRRARRLRK